MGAILLHLDIDAALAVCLELTLKVSQAIHKSLVHIVAGVAP